MKKATKDLTYTFRLSKPLLAAAHRQARLDDRGTAEWLRELIRAELANKRADGPKNAIGGTHS